MSDAEVARLTAWEEDTLAQPEAQFLMRGLALAVWVLGGVFCAVPVGAAEHPRILFSEEDIRELRRRAQTTHREIAAPIMEFAEKSVGATPPLAAPDVPDLNTYRAQANQLLAFAFAYVLTGNERYLELTRRHLLAHAEWSHWGDEGMVGGRDLGFHHLLQSHAIAYDWLYHALSEVDRQAIGSNLARRAEESYEASVAERSYCSNWWRRSYIQNHHWNCHSALGMAALALEGEDTRASIWLADATEHMERVRYLLEGIADGSWHEGIPYQTYGITVSLPFLQSLRRLTGRDLIPHTYHRNYGYWWLYNTRPNSARFIMSFGDFDWRWGEWGGYEPPSLIRSVAQEYRDGHAQWAAEHLLANDRRYASLHSAPWYVYEFLNFDPTVASVPPVDLPLHRTFPDLGVAIWRTGWEDDDLLFGFKAGAYGGRFAYGKWLAGEYPFDRRGTDSFNAGHDHADAGTFYLYRGKRDLSSEVVKYGGDKTSLHNALLIDGQGQYSPPPTWGEHQYWDRHPELHRGTDARLEAVYTTDHFGYMAADVTDCYRAIDPETGKPGQRMLDAYRRHVLFARPRYFVIVDSLRASSPHRYEWVCHFGSSVSREDGWLKGEGEDEQVLGVRVVAPDPWEAAFGDDGKPYARVRPPADVADARFATVLFPTDMARWAERPEVTVLASTDQSIGIRVTLEGEHDHLTSDCRGSMVEVGDYQLDGAVASVSRTMAGQTTRMFLGGGTELRDSAGARLLLRGDLPDLVVEATLSGGELRLAGERLDGLTVYAPGVSPDRVMVNGQHVRAAKRGDYLRLPERLDAMGPSGDH